ncbi:hypothetical protein K523DRAFT_95199 [Schizophyllum commune Tattone D]|nr:hypothetical protein K523DRAFT_95199 [Schizophyllum commune Tattone D]
MKLRARQDWRRKRSLLRRRPALAVYKRTHLIMSVDGHRARFHSPTIRNSPNIKERSGEFYARQGQKDARNTMVMGRHRCECGLDQATVAGSKVPRETSRVFSRWRRSLAGDKVTGSIYEQIISAQKMS